LKNPTEEIELMERRRFLTSFLTGILSCLAAASLIYPIVAFITFRRSKTRDVFFELKDMGTEMSYKEGVYLIGRMDDLKALSGRCTHLGCLVNFNPITGRFECPCHGSIYDREGRRIRGPARRDLKRLPLKMTSDGRISVTLEM
jgi:cytochrome b6-f complex iron-sulfur subunit